MPGQILDAFHHGKHWLTSTTGAPLRVAYDFLFPPLDHLYLDDTASSDTTEWRANTARRALYDTGTGSSSSASSGFHADGSIEHVDAWDSFSDSPWNFVISRYAIALVIAAIVNNRVQHICRPRGGGIARLSQLQRIALRLPSLILLARSVFIFTTVVADAFLAESNPVNTLLRSCTTASWRNAWLANTPMSGWALDRFGSSSRDALLRARDASALWAAFISTCVAVITDSVVRNLDADREEPPAFNLVGFAFLLHFHSFSPDSPANEHVYLCVLLQMLQILSTALSRCRRPVYAPRLVISSFFGIGSLLHYVLAANSGRYPFLEALSRTPEIALVLVVLLTVTLHALTMLLLEGGIQPDRLLFSRSNLPSMDEDWSLALFKLGTACMESTRLTGLEREVEPLLIWDVPYIELSSSGQIQLVDPLLSRSSTMSHMHDPSHHFTSAESGGLSREIKEIRIEPTVQSGSSYTFGHAGLAWVRALVHFVAMTLLVLRNLSVMTFRKVLRTVGLPDPTMPRWVYKALRLVRLVWHGRNGEARRRERRAAEAQRRRQRQGQQQRYAQRHHNLTGSVELAQSQRGSRSVGSLLGFSRLYRAEAAPLRASPMAAEMDEAARCPSLAESRRSGLARLDSPNREIAATAADVGSDEGDDDFDLDVAKQDVYDSDDGEAQESAEELEADEVSGLLEDLGFFAEREGTEDTTTSTQLTVRSGAEAFNRLLLAHLTRSRSQAPLTRSAYNSLLRLSSASTDQDSTSWSSGLMAQADMHLAQSLIDRLNHQRGSRPRIASDDARRLTPGFASARAKERRERREWCETKGRSHAPVPHL
uniref:Uncharacterized protein n=1 Tax=Melanopsichium pennsylvanicum 4 TaxID=1398559 RepID=A0A077RD93_9BASI|nr:conserved hypothetical protein [Melanopsichium pennsylvanicum 4]